MTITTVYRDGRAVAIDLETTVGINLPPTVETTQRLVPPPRRPNAVGERRIRIPRTIGIVDSPCDTGQLPLFIQAALHRPATPTYGQRLRYAGRRRAVRPGLLVRLFRALFGRRDGA